MEDYETHGSCMEDYETPAGCMEDYETPAGCMEDYETHTGCMEDYETHDGCMQDYETYTCWLYRRLRDTDDDSTENITCTNFNKLSIEEAHALEGEIN